mmetsp:Transcript_15027/g.16683  ORF Transcript_15027/g.16683 Transcript_15027/m.16683 type:complete len:156 (-) Transcript_15027:339-806(-)
MEYLTLSKYRIQRKLAEQTICYDIEEQDRAKLQRYLSIDKGIRYGTRGLVPILFLLRVPTYTKTGLSAGQGTFIFGALVGTFLLSDVLGSHLMWQNCEGIINQYSTTSKSQSKNQPSVRDRILRAARRKSEEKSRKEEGEKEAHKFFFKKRKGDQ